MILRLQSLFFPSSPNFFTILGFQKVWKVQLFFNISFIYVTKQVFRIAKKKGERDQFPSFFISKKRGRYNFFPDHSENV